MRRYHRWLAPLFAIVLLWIAVTGLTIQFIKLSTPAKPAATAAADSDEASAPSLISAAQAHEHDEAAKPAVAATPAPVAMAANATPAPPETDIDRIRRERHDLSEFVMDLHSGKVLGTFGTWLSIVSGVVLIFLAGSGLWMYVAMFRARAAKERAIGGQRFWR